MNRPESYSPCDAATAVEVRLDPGLPESWLAEQVRLLALEDGWAV